MGLFDVFKGGGGLSKHAQRVANKRAQQHERWESIQALASDGSDEALRALLVRFTIRVDPSITDGEEKEATFAGIVKHGDAAVGPVRDFLESSDSLGWALKLLKALQSDEEVTTTLLELLEKMDTEYERDPQKKIDVLSSLEERTDPRIVDATKRFVGDINETARFHAVSAIFAQDNADEARETLGEAVLREESVRVRMMILDGFIEQGWKLDLPKQEIAKKLPPGYSIGKKGEVRKRG